MKESDMYQPIKEYLEKLGYEVFAEVELGNGRADVIGYNKPAVCIVEMKTSLSMGVIEQAYNRLRYGHYVYIAIPERTRFLPAFVYKILKDFRIGVLEVNKYGGVSVSAIARFNRPYSHPDWDRILLPEHKTWVEGGTSGGGYVTPYKITMNRVRALLARNPHRWFSLKEILDHCETHYANPRNSLSKALREFEHEWCEYKVEKGKAYFRLR